MAYFELDKVGYDNLIKAAGARAGQVAKVCNEQGVWNAEAQAEAPPDAVPEETVADVESPSTEDVSEEEVTPDD